MAAADFVLPILTYLAAHLLKAIRGVGVHRLPRTRAVLDRVGVLPIRDHYYEPLTRPDRLRRTLQSERLLPGIDFNEAGQLALLRQFDYSAELTAFPLEAAGPVEFYYRNGSFASGDAEMLYSMIRHFKPARVIEIGSGVSTLLVRSAIEANRREMTTYACRHVCIEPYEAPWLESTGAEVIRELVERLDPSMFLELDRNDVLFIDSSHMIRPQGDVLFEVLELLPQLRPGVFVHFHDIFTPRDYLREWVVEQRLLWNEQYLVEAFLSCNRSYQIVAALNFLAHRHPEALGRVCPVFAKDRDSREPGSLWLVRADA